MQRIKVETLSADELYERTKIPCNRDLFAETSEDGSRKKRLHYLCPREYRRQIHVTVSVGDRIVAVGGLQLNPHDNSMYWVQHVSVEEAYRGKGYARMVINQIYMHAMNEGRVVSPSSFSELGQRLKHIFARFDELYPETAAGEPYRDL